MSKNTVIITGTTRGIGKASAELFLKRGFKVIGIDILEASIKDENYTHYVADVGFSEKLPNIEDADYLINNAGTIEEETAIRTNLLGYINVAEKYKTLPSLKSILMIGSISCEEGLDLPMYCASQGGRVGYMRNLANRIGHKKHIPVNLLSFGPTLTGLEPYLYTHTDLLDRVSEKNLANGWITPEQAAEWVFFMSVTNKCAYGQNLICDNGELASHEWVHVKEVDPFEGKSNVK